jgi:hypothetical protein
MKTFASRLPDVQYLDYVRNIVIQCKKYEGPWKIDGNKLAEIKLLLEKAEVAYKNNSKLTTKNRATSKAKKYAFQALKSAMNWFTTYLVQNMDIPDQALAEMKIRARHTHRSSRPAPTKKGYLKVTKKDNKYKISLNLQTDNQTRKSSIDENATGGTEWRYKKKGAEKEETKRSSKSSIVIETTEDERGEILLVCGRWVNSKYEGGPWSDWIEIIIS